MSFTHFLNEGLIKLPERLTKELHEFFLQNYLSFLYYNALQQAEDEIDSKLIKSVFTKLIEKYSTTLDLKLGKKLTGQKTTAARFKNEIPPSYIKALERKHGGVYRANNTIKPEVKITLVFDASSRVSTSRGTYYVNANEIIISIPNLSLGLNDVIEYVLTRNVLTLMKRIDKAINTIDHELTHAIQFIALKDLNAKQVAIKGSVDKDSFEDSSAYLTSQIEFDPWIKNSITDIKHLKTFSGGDMAAKKKAIERFTWADVDTKSMTKDDEHDEDRSHLFKHLKLTSINKWRNAVKLLVTELLK